MANFLDLLRHDCLVEWSQFLILLHHGRKTLNTRLIKKEISKLQVAVHSDNGRMPEVIDLLLNDIGRFRISLAALLCNLALRPHFPRTPRYNTIC